ncbi:hypothetical protein Tsubulata_002722 [Turnera subulata]|uniref:Calycin-like protein n=1 Tax=Turnera subulata TaxID=218843 RepID=A0A9Q0JMY1_9ROSI|nr:hypothetical protein Tsubulata_002722 [Turnera subulata]
MQSSPCLHFHETLIIKPHLRLHPAASSSQKLSVPSGFRRPESKALVTKCQNKPRQPQQKARAKGDKDNPWSIDNEMAKAAAARERERAKQKRRRAKRMLRAKRGRNDGGTILVTGGMLMEVETILQTQEPVIRPIWNTFASSVSGIWKGIGAAFSPNTAEMEPIDIGSKNENLYDCYTLSRIEAVPSASGGQATLIQRKTNWVTLNPHGELRHNSGNSIDSKEVHKSGKASPAVLPGSESLNFETSDLMEEDIMGNEPGLVFFEDGSYSRGPIDIQIAEFDESNYYLSPTFKFEQCLVKGCHKRLRIAHTIEFNSGGSDIQIMRVAVYEEQWVSPANIQNTSDLEFDLTPFSQRKRTQPSELSGYWKVFEVSATPVFSDDEMVAEDTTGTPYVYLCNETLKKRRSPENAYFGEEEIIDMQDATVLWLPGGVTAYVDVNKDGILCIGVGWYSDEGINLVMERDYGTDGKLKEVRSKSEVKRRWPETPPV